MSVSASHVSLSVSSTPQQPSGSATASLSQSWQSRWLILSVCLNPASLSQVNRRKMPMAGKKWQQVASCPCRFAQPLKLAGWAAHCVLKHACLAGWANRRVLNHNCLTIACGSIEGLARPHFPLGRCHQACHQVSSYSFSSALPVLCFIQVASDWNDITHTSKWFYPLQADLFDI